MSVLTCHRDGGGEYTSDESHREHTEHWIIKCDRKTHSAREVRLLANKVGPDFLPLEYDRHPADSLARLVSMQVAQRKDSPEIYDATGKYDTKLSQSQQQQQDQNPLTRPVKYRLELQQFERVVQRDLRGRAIQNTIGEAIKLVIDDTRQILCATRNIRTLNEIVALQQNYKDAVNLNPFYGASPRQAKVVSITAGDEQAERDVRFYEVQIRIAFKERGESWQPKVLNEGMARYTRSFDPSSLTTKVQGNRNEFISTPVQLGIDGTQLSIFSTPYFIPFKVYPERDFRGLRI